MPLNHVTVLRACALKLCVVFSVGYTFANTDAETQPAKGKIGSIASMVKGLEDRLAQQPDDMKGWALLGKSYYHLQRLPEAKVAFDKATELGYTGDMPNLSAAATTPSASSNSGYHKTAYINQPLSSAISQITQEKSATQGIKVKVQLAPSAGKKLMGNEAVFIFARASNGMPAPLAVTRKKVSDLPLEITLDDKMAMMPGHNISSASEVIIGARISMTGDVKKQSGDLEALSEAIPATHQSQVVLTISE